MNGLLGSERFYCHFSYMKIYIEKKPRSARIVVQLRIQDDKINNNTTNTRSHLV